MLVAVALLLAAAPAHAAKAKKLTRYATSGETCKPVKPLTEDTEPSTSSVSGALPAPPAGQKWRIAFAANTNGFVVRVFLGDTQVGSGLIRWDRSFRLDLFLDDFDVSGTPVDIRGRIEGCDITDKQPLTKVTAAIDGTVQLADGISLSRGKLLWDKDGMRLEGTARIACSAGGALTGTATVDYRTPETWTLHILGSSEGTCVLDEGLSIRDATVGGTITAKDGALDGRLTGYAKVAGPQLPFGEWEAEFELLMTGTVKKSVLSFSADARNPAGFAKVTIGPDGELKIELNLIGGETSSGEEVPVTDGYVDPASLLPPPAPAAAPKAKRRCKVPKVKRGATLTTVRRAMTKANCKVRVKRVRSKKVRKGRVVGLYVKVGRFYKPGTRITVRVSAGKPKAKPRKQAARRR